ncbi:MAG: Zn-dependent alcohol dehydrogenase [Gammaproteobacteria bacterium]|nr:Zn-dependent alcohol dehydrogenase [Gammaproteobacteria bacterium]
MKAAICKEFGQPLVVEELKIAPPAAGEVKVKISACAICHSDILYMDGAWGGDLPSVFGHEAAGIVEQTGAGVDHLKPGDHVVVTLIRSCGSCYFCSQGEPHICETEFALDKKGPITSTAGAPVKQGLRTGAFAEQVVVHHSQVVSIPHEIPLDSASLLACGVITGLGAVVNTAAVKPASNVVVIGTGGVGLNSVQGAVLCGAQTIIAVDIANSKLDAAKSFGATHTINSSNENLKEGVFELTQNRGADYVFVTVGNTKAIEQGAELLRKGGTMVIVGMTASGVKSELETLEIANNAQRILGSKMGATRLQLDMPKLVNWYQQGRLKLDELISGRYPLNQINEAIASTKQGDALRNVVVFD